MPQVCTRQKYLRTEQVMGEVRPWDWTSTLAQLPQLDHENDPDFLVFRGRLPKVGTTNRRLLLGSAAVGEVPGPGGGAGSSAPCRDAPRSAAARCGRRWSARQCRCSGSARTPP